jgi:hypothetical protein
MWYINKIGLTLLLFPVFNLFLYSQSDTTSIKNFQASDFMEFDRFLSSDITQGREVGTPGSDSASSYIVSELVSLGLMPFFHAGDSFVYVQTFNLIKQSLNYSSLEINDVSKNKTLKIPVVYSEENGYIQTRVERCIQGVFCGYGISSKLLSYNDYENVSVEGKAVIILDHFPGYSDTLSLAYQNFKTTQPEDSFDLESKIKTAEERGASCLIIIEENDNEYSDHSELYYDEPGYYLPDHLPKSIPCLIVKRKDCKFLLSMNEHELYRQEKKMAELCKPESYILGGKTISLSLVFITDTIVAKNIAGKYSGKDTTSLFIVGAHYDHLGNRGNKIYSGADDNASGTSGVLALANKFKESVIQPNHTMVFAFWDAEEKGLLGSSYFIESYNERWPKIIQYINIDMISRSAPDDTLRHILSIGTRPIDQSLINTAQTINYRLPVPFSLDLWDVTGHFGSDYASFRDKNIPVMTFFSGFHDDYHTPADVFSKIPVFHYI